MWDTNASILATCCRCEGYTAWIGIGRPRQAGSSRTIAPEASSSEQQPARGMADAQARESRGADRLGAVGLKIASDPHMFGFAVRARRTPRRFGSRPPCRRCNCAPSGRGDVRALARRRAACQSRRDGRRARAPRRRSCAPPDCCRADRRSARRRRCLARSRSVKPSLSRRSIRTAGCRSRKLCMRGIRMRRPYPTEAATRSQPMSLRPTAAQTPLGGLEIGNETARLREKGLAIASQRKRPGRTTEEFHARDGLRAPQPACLRNFGSSRFRARRPRTSRSRRPERKPSWRRDGPWIAFIPPWNIS